jgi:hypothetical protein
VSERATTFSSQIGPATRSDHHLWRNGRRWWIAFTYHTEDGRKFRVRRSLGTCEVAEARRRRDELLAEFQRRAGCRLSLRFAALSSFELPMSRQASA